MRESLKQFLAYNDSDDELEYYIRMHADWNEESFVKMRQLIRKVIEDYSDDDYYPKTFVYYCMKSVERIIGIISRIEFCNTWPEGFTKESYKDFITARIDQLELLQKEFIGSL
ncbi:hypothetical protein [Paenibacillus macquariensis]|uniref:Uncharacterized protein n=2 Tax=Paenibacillus macquariensis TaxID=948756 RepID=A0ABY1JV42_9BACL|nr:hypothetical protein [Paenibacillus macquariensis]MEC0090851.1 hypothetical protein [Paenibacillus macquariensis]SIQ82145.1 hypothetical protein SAMN05421578_104212 [Paenibacillus macquariensis]